LVSPVPALLFLAYEIRSSLMMNLNGISAVKFGATWCPPCKALEPGFKKMAVEFPDIRFLSVDIDDDPHQAKDHRIRAVPTVILFRDGHEVDRLVGDVKITALRKRIRGAIKDRAA
jgi:thioredoxin 1